jgi:hypothetical protein
VEGAIRYEGYGADIAIEGETLLLTKKGFGAKMIGSSGTRRIPFRALTDVKFKDATRLVNGWIQLAVGGVPADKAQASDPNTVLFRHKSQGEFERLRDYLLKVIERNRELSVDASTAAYDPARQALFDAAQRRQAELAAREAFAREVLDGVEPEIAAQPGVERNLSRLSSSPSRPPSSLTPRRGRAVFVSYSSDDRGYVGRLAAHLQGAGIDVWYDHRIAPGQQWEDVIRGQIEECGVLMVVMTPSAHESRWVKREINYAEELRKDIVPLLLAGTPFFRLSDLHYERVTGGRMPSSQLVEHLRTLISRPPQP